MSSFQYVHLLQQDTDSEPKSVPEQSKAPKYGIFAMINAGIVCFLLGIVITVLSFTIGLADDAKYATWSYSLRTHLATKWIQFEGGLFKENPYRGQPSKIIDDAWARYTESPWFDGGAVVLTVTEDDIRRSRKASPEEWLNSTVELDVLNGGGYMATLELFHQMHCLDMIRRYTYPEHYPMDSFKSGKASMRDHIDHCIDMVRQALMCSADTTLITFHWAEGIQVPVPDFYTWHQCRDPEAILQWAVENAAPITHSILKPDGIVETPTKH